MEVLKYQPAANEIQFDIQFFASEEFVFADPDRLRQVFLNILLNAVDALNAKPPDQPLVFEHLHQVLEQLVD